MNFTSAAQIIVNYAPHLSDDAAFHLLRCLISGSRLYCPVCSWFHNPGEPCLCSMTN